jgi:hypothetical protein
MRKKLAVAIIIALLGIYLLYELKVLTASLVVCILIILLAEALLMTVMWTVLLEVCLRRILEGLHFIKHIQPPLTPLKVPIHRRVGHFG